jgi:asparagine synthetase B (glutamine-hydrolysing)
MTSAGSGLRPLEIASGLVFGTGPGLDGSEVPRSGEALLATLERVVLQALLRPPCLVSFSGGRDSSAVLAVATHVARREGLALPVPATHRFGSVATSAEDEWQEQVVAHLGLDDWARLETEGELDCLGPVATRTLRRHGLLWPFNAHFHVPLLDLARGGSLLTGIGGDEMLTESRWTEFRNTLTARRRPAARDALRIGFLAAPRTLKHRALARRFSHPYAWLRPAARREVVDDWAAQAASEPHSWTAHIRWVRRLRYLEVGLASMRRLAADDDVQLIHPFLDAGFAGSLSRLPRGQRFAGRTAAMQALFGDLLPDPILMRSTKASFDGAFWNAASRSFAAEWDGAGVDNDLVDSDALRKEWRSASPDPRSFTLAQSVWLALHASSRDRVEQAGDRLSQ